jgi:peroxiredoxin
VLGILLGGAGIVASAREASAREVGQPAPDFTLPATTGDKISLSQFRGKQPVLIEFYGADFAPVWADNLSARKADYGKFQELNIQILGISRDGPFSQKTFADSLKLPFPLLSDMGLTVARSYGVVYGSTKGETKSDYPELKGLSAKRSFFLIDRKGIIRGRWIGEDMGLFPTDVLLKAAREMVAKG